MTSQILFPFLWASALLLLSACAPTVKNQPNSLDGISGGLRVGDIVETRSGDILTPSQLIGELTGVDVIYVGETHTSSEDHRVQLRLMRDLHRQNPSLILAMEMFRRRQQPILDRYSTGQMSDEEFVQEIDWETEWGYPFPLYRDILNWARDHHVPIVGLNAPREVVAKIAREGLAALGPQERTLIARDFHLDDPVHENYVREQYQGHHKGAIKDFNAFFEAQLAWEETMAETLALTLATRQPHQKILVLIGKGHISNGVGVPSLTLKRVQHTYKTIAPMPVNFSGSLVDPDLADFVWITEPSEAPLRPRLGVLVRRASSGVGLEILEVRRGTPSDRAGIQAGDILLAVGGITVNTVEELREALSDVQGPIRVEVARGQRRLSLSVQFSP